LWTAHELPPVLPAIDSFGGINYLVPLLVLATAMAFVPKFAGPACALGLVGAMLGDQTRMQPEVISLCAIATLAAYGDVGRTLCRWHLASIWVWAGTHKLLSSGWDDIGSPLIAGWLGFDGLRPVVFVVVPLGELVLGLAACYRRTYRVAAFGAIGLHVGIFITLAFFASFNSVVWPWNLALAATGFWLFRETPRRSRPNAVVASVASVIMLSPLAYYPGWLDAYLSHQLYSGSPARAQVCEPAEQGCSDSSLAVFYDELNVPLPPEPRLYGAWFVATCEPGQTLEISGRQTVFESTPGVSVVQCPAETR